jgi:hypothetical protein
MPWYLWTAIAVMAVLALLALFLIRSGATPKLARTLFLKDRLRLEAEFWKSASSSGKPRGLRWKAIEWEQPIEFARETKTGRYAALIGITLSFEAVEGGDMEGVAAVGNLRNASAVFFFDRGQWHTTGRAVFNLNPDEAIRHFQYEPLTFDQA